MWPPNGWYVHDSNRDLRIRFQCVEEGGAKVVWMFKGESLSASSPCVGGAARTVCGPLLHISKFRDEFAGQYTCRNPLTSREVHVPLGSECVGLLVISFFLLLSAFSKVQPEFVDPHQTDYVAAVGERVELNCYVKPNVFPNASVVWQKQERSVHLGEKYTIQKAGLNDSGTYTCRATNNPDKAAAGRSKRVVLYVYRKCIHYKNRNNYYV